MPTSQLPSAATRAPARSDAFDAARGARLSAAMRAQGLVHNHQLSHRLGVSESTLGGWRSGVAMSVSNAIGLARQLNVSLDWLLAGRSPPSATAAASTTEPTQDVLADFAVLPAQDRQLVMSMCRLLATRDEPVADARLASG